MLSKTKIKCKIPIEQNIKKTVDINSYTKDKLTLDIDYANKTIDKIKKSILNHEIELKEKEQKLQDVTDDLTKWFYYNTLLNYLFDNNLIILTHYDIL